MIEEYSTETIKQSLFSNLVVNRNIAKHTHYFWEFTYAVNGEITNLVNDQPTKTHVLSEIVIIKPGDTHEIVREKKESADPPPTTLHRDIYVMPEKMKKCCEMLSLTLYDELLSAPSLIIDAKNEHLETLEYTLKLFQQYNDFSQKNNEFLDKLHTTVVFQLLGMYLKQSHVIKKAMPPWIEQFFEQLKDEDFLCKKIDEIIRSFNYSHSYICREFKKYVGKTMVQCLNESRIIYSTILLTDPEMTILNIAMQLNYSSQSAYINAFKSVYKISPHQWRKKQFNL